MANTKPHWSVLLQITLLKTSVFLPSIYLMKCGQQAFAKRENCVEGI